MSSRDRVLALSVVFFWGVNFVVIDWGLQGVPPLLFVALRFCVVSLAVLVVPRPRARWTDVALVGLLMSVGQFGLMYTALASGMPPGLASLVLQAQSALTVVFAVLVLREHPRPQQVLGVLLGLVGLGVIGLGRGGSVPLGALALTIGAAACWAAGNVAARRLQGVPGLSLTVWSGLVVPVPLVVLSLVVDGPATVGHALTHLPASAWLATLYTAVLASLFGYGVWNSLLSRHRAAEVAPFSLLVPVFGMSAAYLVQGERPALLALAGGVLLVAGVAVTLVPRPARRSTPTTDTPPTPAPLPR